MTRKSPILHTVKRHKRRGQWVESFERGNGRRVKRTRSRVVGSRESGVVTREDVTSDLIKLNRKYGVNIEIIGGIKERGYSENDIDLISRKEIDEDIAWKFVDYFSGKYAKKTDIFIPMNEEYREMYSSGYVEEFSGQWIDAVPEKYLDWLILSRHGGGFSRGHVSDKALRTMNRRIKGLAYRSAILRREKARIVDELIKLEDVGVSKEDPRVVLLDRKWIDIDGKQRELEMVHKRIIGQLGPEGEILKRISKKQMAEELRKDGEWAEFEIPTGRRGNR